MSVRWDNSEYEALKFLVIVDRRSCVADFVENVTDDNRVELLPIMSCEEPDVSVPSAVGEMNEKKRGEK